MAGVVEAKEKRKKIRLPRNLMLRLRLKREVRGSGRENPERIDLLEKLRRNWTIGFQELN